MFVPKFRYELTRKLGSSWILQECVRCEFLVDFPGNARGGIIDGKVWIAERADGTILLRYLKFLYCQKEVVVRQKLLKIRHLNFEMKTHFET